jgi:hypothetical protein
MAPVALERVQPRAPLRAISVESANKVSHSRLLDNCKYKDLQFIDPEGILGDDNVYTECTFISWDANREFSKKDGYMVVAEVLANRSSQHTLKNS